MQLPPGFNGPMHNHLAFENFRPIAFAPGKRVLRCLIVRDPQVFLIR